MRTLLVGSLVSLGIVALTTAVAAPGENVTAKASAPARLTKIGDQNAKVFDTWGSGEIKRGDCSARNAKLVVYQNGSVEWDAEMRSTDAGDEWEQSFAFYEGAPKKTLLGNKPTVRFNIKAGNKWLPWRSGGPSSPDPKLAGVFERIQVVEWESSC